ncbi:MBOAT family O-acyltransferase [Flavobacterium sp.]|uniref:MBOAT family O-acyltransferase n=1 Tax=Flavobacterium sp. TaxID=239 RepID=UPI00286DC1D2|nr:MBOAT family O-acyltransferase [Flavobacterium sp.]
MLFNSYIFFVFLFVVLSVFYFLKEQRYKKYWLVLASLFFYAYWDWKLLGLLLVCIISNYYFAICLKNSAKSTKNWLVFGIVFNLSVLIIFKYFNFFIDSFDQITKILGFSLNRAHLYLVLPIGISFYTFKAIAYLIDVYKKQIEPTREILDLTLYLSFFPQLIAGPIQRAEYIFPQLASSLTPSKTQVKDAFFLISIGLFQKVMIGDACGRIVDSIFFDLSKYSSFEIVSAVVLFTFQIYADFAGYSNIARGLAKLFGIELTINFKQPYSSKNIKEFWERWHISLSTWLRDYLYIPLGGNRNGKNILYRNLLIVMILGGLWHGAGWNYILWGFYHGLLLILFHSNKSISLPKYVNSIVTFMAITIGWAIFRITSLSQLNLFLQELFILDLGNYYGRFIKMILTFGCVLFTIDWLQIKYKNDAIFTNFKNQSFAFGLTASLLFVSLIYILTKKTSPFIYFQF